MINKISQFLTLFLAIAGRAQFENTRFLILSNTGKNYTSAGSIKVLDDTNLTTYVNSTLWQYSFNLVSGVIPTWDVTSGTSIYAEFLYTQSENIVIPTSIELRIQEINSTNGYWTLIYKINNETTTITTPYEIIVNKFEPFSHIWFYIDHYSGEMHLSTLQCYTNLLSSNTSSINGNSIIDRSRVFLQNAKIQIGGIGSVPGDKYVSMPVFFNKLTRKM
jgi:hypothetical protein